MENKLYRIADRYFGESKPISNKKKVRISAYIVRIIQ
jgi:hypothetical protein